MPVPMFPWPLWRLLVWIEAWLLGIAIVHLYRPIHEAFVVPLLMGIIPAGAVVALWALSKAASGQTASPDARASLFEFAIAALSVVAAAFWVVRWAFRAAESLRRMDEVLGQATLIVDISLTGLSAAACLAALALDWLLATAHEQLRATMIWVRRTHLTVTVVHVGMLFGAAWLLTAWPVNAPASDTDGFFRARAVLYVYEYAKATVFPVQALFAALAVAVVTLDSRSAH